MRRFMMTPPPQETSLQRACHHPHRTKAGPNAYQNSIKCKDCGYVLHLKKKAAPKSMETKETTSCSRACKNYEASSAPSTPGDPALGPRNPKLLYVKYPEARQPLTHSLTHSYIHPLSHSHSHSHSPPPPPSPRSPPSSPPSPLWTPMRLDL